MKSVQISEELFFDLAIYHLKNADPKLEDKIRIGLSQKIDAMLAHEFYSQMKTAPTQEEREKARQEYIEAIRWKKQ